MLFTVIRSVTLKTIFEIDGEILSLDLSVVCNSDIASCARGIEVLNAIGETDQGRPLAKVAHSIGS